MQLPIYLDYHATTPCDPRVVEAMQPYFSEMFANPASAHEAGNEAAQAVESARSQVAQLLGGQPHEVVFTSGATESNNLALLGAARRHAKMGGTRRRLVTTSVEHKAVLGPLRHLAEEGWDIVLLPVDSEGVVDLEAAERAINQNTLLVSVQAANHEIGTLQPVREVTRLAHAHGALMHCDAAQAVGKVLLDVEALGVDLLSVSGHKLYAPKGVGALWMRGGPRRLPLEPLCFGGGQEDSLRPGTLPVPLIVGLGVACDLSRALMPEESRRIQSLRDELETHLCAGLPNVRPNGALRGRLPGNSNLTFDGIEAEIILTNAPEVAVSTGSACQSGTIEPSRVLLAIGRTSEAAFCTLRFGLGRFTTAEDVDIAANYVVDACRAADV